MSNMQIHGHDHQSCVQFEAFLFVNIVCKLLQSSDQGRECRNDRWMWLPRWGPHSCFQVVELPCLLCFLWRCPKCQVPSSFKRDSRELCKSSCMTNQSVIGRQWKYVKWVEWLTQEEGWNPRVSSSTMPGSLRMLFHSPARRGQVICWHYKVADRLHTHSVWVENPWILYLPFQR